MAKKIIYKYFENDTSECIGMDGEPNGTPFNGYKPINAEETMEYFEQFISYMTLKELRELKVIINERIDKKEEQLKLIKESLK